MSRLKTVTENELHTTTLEALLPFRQRGRLAPVYYQMANSETGLLAYLGLENALRKSTLSNQEIEAIKLLVSELNHCEYCLSVHHMKAGAAGLTDVQKQSIRRGDLPPDTRLGVIVETVRGFFERPGTLTDAATKRLREFGLTDAELVDMTLVTATIFFTNVFNHINGTQSSLPPAPALV